MISALVSAYFAEQYLVARLDNLQRENVETVVICRKGSVEEKIAFEYPCKMVLTPNIPTLYKAWNLGIEAASGEYLTSANCDDLFYDGGLEAMAKHLDTHDCAVVCGDCDRKTENGISRWHRGDGTPISPKFNRVGAMPMWRKSAHDKYGLFDENMVVSGDYDFWLRLFVNGEKICHINEVVGLYWQRRDSIEHRHTETMHQEDVIIRERFANASRTESQLWETR